MSLESFAVFIDSSHEHRDDLVASLGMNNLELIHARSVTDGLTQIKARAPRIIFVRLQVQDDKEAAKSVKDDLGKYEGLCDVPVIILDDGILLKAREPFVRTFQGSAELPIQFPNFPQYVAKLLELDVPINEHVSEHETGLSGAAAFRESRLQSLVKAGPQSLSAVRQEIKNAMPSQSPPMPERSLVRDSDSGAERRRIVVHALLLRIFENIQRVENFDECALIDIPDLVHKTSTQVCSEVDIERLFS